MVMVKIQFCYLTVFKERKVLLVRSAVKCILHRVIRYIKCIETGFVLPEGNDLLLYSYER